MDTVLVRIIDQCAAQRGNGIHLGIRKPRNYKGFGSAFQFQYRCGIQVLWVITNFYLPGERVDHKQANDQGDNRSFHGVRYLRIYKRKQQS